MVCGREGRRARPAEERRRPARRPSSWTDVEKAILLRIVSGVYEPGQQLPSCEQLAAEVGANKNTVSKAYRSLAERGYLRTRAGSGTFVARRPARADSDRAVADIANLLALVVQEAKMAGLQRQQFVTLIDETSAASTTRSGRASASSTATASTRRPSAAISRSRSRTRSSRC